MLFLIPVPAESNPHNVKPEVLTPVVADFFAP